VALCVGRLAAEKNLDVLLRAFESLKAADPSARLVLVGDGPERASLQLRCPEAHFAGLRRGDDLAAHYASADLFLFPSVTETFGNVVPEAMASGLPVVGFDYAAARQMVRHGDNGLLVAYDDGEAFRVAAERLAGQLGWVRAMGAQARATACGLDWGRIIQQVESVYTTAISQPMAAPRAAWRPVLP